MDMTGMATLEAAKLSENGQDGGTNRLAQLPERERKEKRNRQLRNIRENVQSVQDDIQRMSKGEATLKMYASHLQGQVFEIRGMLNNVRPLCQDSDDWERLHAIWRDVENDALIRDADRQYEGDELIQHLRFLDGQCRRFIFQAGWMTIPERVKDWIAHSKPGYELSFHGLFADEVPVYEDRVQVLGFLASEPNVLSGVVQNLDHDQEPHHKQRHLGGLVDQDAGVIYVYSQEPKDLAVTIIVLVLAFAAAVAAVIGACYLANVVGKWPFTPADVGLALVGWAALLAGIIVHMAVQAAKPSGSSGGRPRVRAMVDLPYLLNARSGYIINRLLLALIGFFGWAIAFGQGQPSQSGQLGPLSPMDTFLVGYSLDSFLGLFTSRLEQQSRAKQQSLAPQQESANQASAS